MPHKKEIIIFVLLCLIALGLGYWVGMPDKASQQRVEVSPPPAPTVVTNVVTNTVNNIVTNIITNTAPVQPKPNPARPSVDPVTGQPPLPLPTKPNPVSPKTTPTRQLTLKEKDVVGEYECKVLTKTHKLVCLDNGVWEHHINGKNAGYEAKWLIVDGEIVVKIPYNPSRVYAINPDGSITSIALIYKDGKRSNFVSRTLPFKKIK